MAKRLFLPLSMAIIGLTFPFFTGTPFTMLVVDEHTGVGVPSLRVTNGEGIVRYTGGHGELIVWSTSSPTGERFEITDEQAQFNNMGATVKVTPGGHATLKVHRRSHR